MKQVKNPAFTLLELIVVMTIIGILTVVLFLDFQSVQHRQQVALMADQALALMQQAKLAVRAGTVEDTWVCKGGYFDVGAVPQMATTVYDVENQICDFNSKKLEPYGLSPGDAQVGSIHVGGVSLDSFWIFFTPPEAQLIFLGADGSSYVGEGQIDFKHPDEDDLNVELFVSHLTNQVWLTHSEDDPDAHEE